MTKFDVSSNDIRPDGGKALAAGLKGNQVITELNISNNSLGIKSDFRTDTSGIIAIADAIPDMRALLSLDISSNSLYVEGTKLLAKNLESNQTMTSLNVSSNMMTYDGKELGDMSGVAALAAVIPGMGAMTKLEAHHNDINDKEKRALQQVAGSRYVRAPSLSFYSNSNQLNSTRSSSSARRIYLLL
jgi:hypothetical protein